MVLQIYFQAMPRIKVKLFANFREFTKIKETELEGNTVKGILEALCEEFPGIEKMLYNGEYIAPYINILLNGKDIQESEGLKTPLHQNDEIAIFPPVSGG
jgi:molybdopterin synthase sulfur carrier subunit